MMLPCVGRERNTLSHRQVPIWGMVMEAACSSGSRSRGAILLTFQKEFPFYPRKQTQSGHRTLSGSCHIRTHAPQQSEPYPIASSARPIKVAGTGRPSDLAVLRLTTVSNLVGSLTAKFHGFEALRTPPL